MKPASKKQLAAASRRADALIKKIFHTTDQKRFNRDMALMTGTEQATAGAVKLLLMLAKLERDIFEEESAEYLIKIAHKTATVFYLRKAWSKHVDHLWCVSRNS